MLNFTFDTECTDFIIGAFDPQYMVELIIHFDGYFIHMAFDSRVEDALDVIRTGFVGAVISNTFS